MKKQTKIVIIGGGIVGCGIAFHLSKLGCKDIVVIEQGPLFDTGGSSSHAPGLMFQSNPSKTMTEFAKYSVNLYKDLQLNGNPVFNQTGSLEIAWTDDRLKDLKRKIGFSKSWGLNPTLITKEDARKKIPILTNRIKGALYMSTDGVANGVGVTKSLGQIAQNLGATFYGNTMVTGIKISNGKIQAVSTDQGDIKTDIVVSAAGIWGPLIGKMAGVSIPLVPMEHLYAETTPLPELNGEISEISHPIMRHQDGGLYFRQRGECYGFGDTYHEPIPIDPENILNHKDSGGTPAISTLNHPDAPAAFERAIELIPSLKNVKISHSFGGMFSFTPDAMPILGESDKVNGFWSAEAVWVTHAGGVSKVIAESILNNSSSIDLRECDINRFHTVERKKSFYHQRGIEQYKEGVYIHHPLDQMNSSRNIKLNPFYENEKALNAVFFESAGWEIPQWYDTNKKLLKKSSKKHTWINRNFWAARNWSPIVGAEHLIAREKAAIFDLTSITKIDVQGSDALSFLQSISTNQMDQPIGRVTYTTLLNEKGGIISDLTVTRLDINHFMVMTSTRYGYQDLKWLRDHSSKNKDLTIKDVTNDFGCLCLWGPESRNIIKSISNDDFSNESFKYRDARYVKIGKISVLAIRLSYVGELGWELYVPNQYGHLLWEKIWKAGIPYGLIAAGLGAFTSMRIEKGYRLWGTDIHTEYNPFEAGLEFVVRLKKGDFIGKNSIINIKKNGIEQKLCCLTLEDPQSVIMGSEPVMFKNKIIGFITSTDYGYSVNKGIAYAYLPLKYSKSGTKLKIMYFEKMFDAVVSEEPLYDPKGRKMRI